MNVFHVPATWLRTWRERKARRERMLAVMVVLKATTPGTPPPSPDVQRWVNRTLKRRIFTTDNEAH